MGETHGKDEDNHQRTMKCSTTITTDEIHGNDEKQLSTNHEMVQQ